MSLNKELLEDLGLKEITPVDMHPHKRKIRPLVPREPVRKSQRIYELTKRKELEKLKRRKNRATKESRPKKEEPEYIDEETSESESESEHDSEPGSESESESESEHESESDYEYENDNESEIDSEPESNPEPNSGHKMVLRRSSYPKPYTPQKQRGPIKVDTTTMFSPIKVKVNDTREYAEEWYTKDDLSYLGTCRQRYPYMNIAKVADVRGTVCHQCLQRTRDKKTACPGCNGPNGVICGQCLQTRYGENILEVFQRGNKWRCPSCRGICNCNACRELKNLQPIGAVCASTLGYPSVAHWIMHTHLRK